MMLPILEKKVPKMYHLEILFCHFFHPVHWADFGHFWEFRKMWKFLDVKNCYSARNPSKNIITDISSHI